MRVAAGLAGLTLLSLAALVACTPAAAPAPTITPQAVAAATPAPKTVSIKGFAFNPATMEIAKGTLVTWTNEDAAPHTVSSGTVTPAGSPAVGASPSPAVARPDGKIESGRFENGKTFAYTFNEAGTFAYFCQVHHRMIATVVVK